MNAAGMVFSLVVTLLQAALPRRWALLPLLVTVAWMTRGQVLDVGGLNFPVMRLVIAAGLIRVVIRGERVAGGANKVDLWLVMWAVMLLATAPFHSPGAFVFRLGVVWDYLGGYYLARAFLQDTDDIARAFRMLCLLLVPVAALMLVEKYSDRNLFGVLGGVSEVSTIRQGNIRASGPFSHPILAGTVGASLMPMALCIRKVHRLSALLGFSAGAAMIWASASSGPVLMEFFVILALLLSRWRNHLSAFRWLALFAISSLAIVMNDPVYFLMAKFDLAGGSTGWYRAELIRSSIEHLEEWWLAGTDYTFHWMPTGNPANAGHADITNQYLQMGVWGGLGLIVIFVQVVLSAFGEVGAGLRRGLEPHSNEFHVVWGVGSILFGLAVNFLSVVLFDQSIVCFLMLLGAVGTFRSRAVAGAHILSASKTNGFDTHGAASGHPGQLPAPQR